MAYRREKLGLGSLLLFALGVEAQGLKVTAGNAVNLGSYWAEITTAAIGPGENRFCSGGRLFFADGFGILATDLNGQAVSWGPRLPNPRSFEYNETFPPHDIYDNHLVKLKDGSLVYVTEAITWNDNVGTPKPEWWQRTVEFPVKKEKRPGGRANLYVRRSEDCGRTWTHVANIDAAKLTVKSPEGVPTKGLCGTPRLIQETKMVEVTLPGGQKGKAPVVTKRAEGGGWDGHYLYADPYNGNLFLSTPCVYGSKEVNKERFLALLLLSTDRGSSWKAIGQIDTQKDAAVAWRMPVTSLPSGHVAFGYLNWKLRQLKLAVVTPPYTQVDLTQGKVLATRSPGELGPGAQVNSNKTDYPTLARNPGKGFLVTAADWKPVDPGTKLAHRFFDVPVNATPGGIQEQAGIAAPGSADMLHGTLIEGTPSADVHLFYWVERSSGTMTADGKFLNPLRVKFQVFKGNKAILTKPGELTVADGKPYAFGAGDFVGDYMGGASYIGADGHLRFVAAWSEEGVLRFNTISLTPQILSAAPPHPVEVQIVPQVVPVQRILRTVPTKVGPKPAAPR